MACVSPDLDVAALVGDVEPRPANRRTQQRPGNVTTLGVVFTALASLPAKGAAPAAAPPEPPPLSPLIWPHPRHLIGVGPFASGAGDIDAAGAFVLLGSLGYWGGGGQKVSPYTQQSTKNPPRK